MNDVLLRPNHELKGEEMGRRARRPGAEAGGRRGKGDAAGTAVVVPPLSRKRSWLGEREGEGGDLHTRGVWDGIYKDRTMGSVLHTVHGMLHERKQVCSCRPRLYTRPSSFPVRLFCFPSGASVGSPSAQRRRRCTWSAYLEVGICIVPRHGIPLRRRRRRRPTGAGGSNVP